MKHGLFSRQFRANHTAQPLERRGQVFGIHLSQFDCHRDIKERVFAFLKQLFAMREQTATENPSKAHERATIADRAFVSRAVADYLTIKAENRIPERKAACV
jgi:hypothetical protein